MAIQIGSVVRLKSGGSNMTVKFFVGDGTASRTLDSLASAQGAVKGDAFCEWFDSKNDRQSGAFPVAMLDEVKTAGKQSGS